MAGEEAFTFAETPFFCPYRICGFCARSEQGKSMNIREFFQQQRTEWPLAKKNFDDLEFVRVNALTFNNGVWIQKQCNPARMVSTAAKIDKSALAKRPCFLCEKNRPPEQKSFVVGGQHSLLINPFPILPMHFTMPSDRHELQRIEPFFPVMLDFVEENPDFCIFYNGPHSGASAPDHMHFQVGEVKGIPFFEQWDSLELDPIDCDMSVQGNIYHVKSWPGACVAITGSKDEVTNCFGKLYAALPIPTNEYEPMFNVFARKHNDDYHVIVFLRSCHRPLCYGSDDGQHMVSPGALDMAGLLITPRQEDFDNITPEEADAIYREVSAPELVDLLRYSLRKNECGRNIAVGLMETDGEIRYSFNGDYKRVDILNDTFFFPCSAECSFTIDNIVIGVNFHWQQVRRLTYSGILKLTKNAEGKHVAINILPIEDYLKSVISSEMSAMSDIELLKAHAILSRSWLIANIEGVHNEQCSDSEGLVWYDRSAHTISDVCADDHCQRYQGVTMQTSPLVEQAVEATRGVVLAYEGKVCDARFSKCCGGRSEEYEYCWDTTQHPYLESVECPFCNTAKQFSSPEEEQKVLRQVLNDYDLETRNFYHWTALYDNPEIREIVPLERGKSGRIWKMKVVYNNGKEEIVGKELEIRRRLSDTHLYSSWFNVHKTAAGFLLEGQGWGHGVGLCQIGAAVMAAKGYDHKSILKHYFPKASLQKV